MSVANGLLASFCRKHVSKYIFAYSFFPFNLKTLKNGDIDVRPVALSLVRGLTADHLVHTWYNAHLVQCTLKAKTNNDCPCWLTLQMGMSSKNTFPDLLRRTIYQLPGKLIVQSCWHLQLVVTRLCEQDVEWLVSSGVNGSTKQKHGVRLVVLRAFSSLTILDCFLLGWFKPKYKSQVPRILSKCL